jgi:hypothetical protein
VEQSAICGLMDETDWSFFYSDFYWGDLPSFQLQWFHVDVMRPAMKEKSTPNSETAGKKTRGNWKNFMHNINTFIR